jgi:cytochrome c oxidase subunit 2
MHSVFDPASPQAHAVANLWWAMLAAATIVWIGVQVATWRALRADKAAAPISEPGEKSRERAVMIATGVTVAILVLFLGYDYSEGRIVGTRGDADITVDVIGHQWWWEIQYPAAVPMQRITTANELHVPVGKLVQIRLKSADVIHSFWVPNLNGKRDLIPGYTTTVWFRADTAGVYRGQCAEFCGLEHAKMALYVIADPPDVFARWIAASLQPDAAPSDSLTARGQMVFLSANCALCHSISGTAAFGSVGPTLTHLKSRQTIAAGTLDNTKENLYGWIVNPAAFKPGTQMPPSTLAGQDLAALVAYLETLK